MFHSQNKAASDPVAESAEDRISRLLDIIESLQYELRGLYEHVRLLRKENQQQRERSQGRERAFEIVLAQAQGEIDELQRRAAAEKGNADREARG